MGIFALACTALSMYIWSATLYDVYKPLSQNLAQAAPSLNPSAIAAALQRALFSSQSATEAQSTTRRGRRRKHLTLAEAQREELREALKVFVIWMSLKGCEPVFDYTFGYVMPFYALVKAFVYLILARFRVQLSKHVFDSFVIPLGKPNTPLINATAFTALVLPTLRFLLSLPFAHLSMAIKNAVLPYLASWSDSQAPEQGSPVARRMENIVRVQPPVHADARKVSGMLSNRGEDRPRGPGNVTVPSGSAYRLLKSQRSMDSISSRPRYPSSSTGGDVRARSVSSRAAPISLHTINRLSELPTVPRTVPSASISSGSAYVMPTFAFVPQHARAAGAPVDVVAPPTDKPVAYFPSASSPRMPGSLGGSPIAGVRAAAHPESSPGNGLAEASAQSTANITAASTAQPVIAPPFSSTGDDVTPKKAKKRSESTKATPRAKRKAGEAAEGDEEGLSKTAGKSPKQRKKAGPAVSSSESKSEPPSQLPVSQSRRNVRARKEKETSTESASGTAERTTRRGAGRTKVSEKAPATR